jgi:hypothetical protein
MMVCTVRGRSSTVGEGIYLFYFYRTAAVDTVMVIALRGHEVYDPTTLLLCNMNNRLDEVGGTRQLTLCCTHSY